MTWWSKKKWWECRREKKRKRLTLDHVLFFLFINDNRKYGILLYDKSFLLPDCICITIKDQCRQKFDYNARFMYIYIYNMILRSAYLLYDADTQDGDNGSTDESFTITTTTTNFFSLFFCSPLFFSLLIVPVDERRKKEKWTFFSFGSCSFQTTTTRLRNRGECLFLVLTFSLSL
jgi:hypothetical protein